MSHIASSRVAPLIVGAVFTAAVAAQCAGTASVTNAVTVLDVAPGIASSNPAEVVTANRMVYWSASNGSDTLWRFDSATQSGPFQVPLNGSNGSNPSSLVAYGEELLLSARSSVGASNEVHRVAADGTFVKLPGAIAVADLVIVGDALFYTGQSAGSRELWRRDLVTGAVGIAYDSPVNGDPSQLTPVGKRLFFSCRITGGGRRLHCYDLATGTTEVFFGVTAPDELAAVGDRLFCAANGGTGIGTELYVSDGTQAGTGLVQNIHLGSGGSSSSNPRDLVAFDGECYFAADSGSGNTGRELWRSDGVTATLVADLRPGGASSNPEALTAAGDGLYFVAAGASVTGQQVYRIEAGGVAQPQCVNSSQSAFGSNPKLAAIGGDLVVASGYGGATIGREAWLHDADGARLLTDLNLINNSSASALPRDYASNPEYLYFVADNGSDGVELYQVAIAELGLATWRRYGRGCPGAAGVPDLAGVGVPSLGNAGFAMKGSDVPPNSIGLFGGGDGIVLLPFGCGLLIETVLATALVLYDADGEFTFGLPIPPTPALAGLVLTFQHFPYDTSAPGHFSASTGLAIYLN